MIKMINSKTHINGIYDAEGTFPSIHAIPNAGHKFIVSITDDFDEPKYYDEVVALLSTASEEDTITFNINSNGGYVSSLAMLLTWKSMCKAYQIHVLSGNASSAASAFFLSNADEYVVSDMASMMVHEYQTSNGGSNSNVIKQATHTAKENEKFIRNCYEYFLDEAEIEDTLKGVEHYLSADEIRERLQQREEIKAQQQSQAENDFLESLTSENIDDIVKELSDDELQEELDGLADVVKELKKEQSKRKKGDKEYKFR